MTNGPALSSHAAFARNLERIDAAWEAWMAAVERVPARHVLSPGVCGDWSVKDLIGHIAVWDDVATRRVQAILDDAPAAGIREVDAFNAREIALRAQRDITDLTGELDFNHARLRAALDRAQGGSPDVMDRISELLETWTWGHYAEHRQQIDAAFPPE